MVVRYLLKYAMSTAVNEYGRLRAKVMSIFIIIFVAMNKPGVFYKVFCGFGSLFGGVGFGDGFVSGFGFGDGLDGFTGGTSGDGFGDGDGDGFPVLVFLRGFGFEKALSGIRPAAPTPFCVCSYPVNLSITFWYCFCFGKLVLTPPPLSLISLSSSFPPCSITLPSASF